MILSLSINVYVYMHIHAYSPPWCNKKSACNAVDTSSITGLQRSPGEAFGYPLQYSCLENSMDRGACQATVYGVTESDMTSDFPFLFPYMYTHMHNTYLYINIHVLILCRSNSLWFGGMNWENLNTYCFIKKIRKHILNINRKRWGRQNFWSQLIYKNKIEFSSSRYY